MIETQFHVLDEVVRFGHTLHGLLINTSFPPTLRAHGSDFPLGPPLFPATLGDRMRLVLGVTDFGLPPEDVYDTHLLKVPGVAPLALPPEEVAAEAAKGRTWQHYALLSGRGPSLFGHQLGGWVCIDPSGQRWLVRGVGLPNIRYGNARIDQPLTLQFEVRPFGYLDQAPVAPVTRQATLADIAQNEPDLLVGGEPYVRMRLSSIASHGRQVVIGLYPRGDLVTQDDLPCGWLLLTLTGNGPTFDFELTVLHSRVAALGARSTSESNGQAMHMFQVDLETDVSGPAPNGDYTLTGDATGLTPVPTEGGGYLLGTRSFTYTVEDRVCCVVFDDGDSLVPITADITWTRTQTRTVGSSSASGTVTSAGTTAGMSPPSGTLSLAANFGGSDVTTTEVVLQRSGVPVDAASWTVTLDLAAAGEATATYAPGWNATLEPPEFQLGVFDVGPLPSTWPIRFHFEVGGQVLLDLQPVTRRPNIAPWTPPIWQNRVDIWEEFSADAGDYDTVRYRMRRLSNQVLACAAAVFRAAAHETPAPPVKDRTHRAFASQALWDNPNPGNDPFGNVAASYHPFTHELFVHAAVDASIAQPFVWI
ncbi:hypothetical protein M2318_002720 [Metapseudomonas resinovorans]|uniref:hypothetical protein n=1 Tax=Metapseudomonas resinovorans TaxID=53412 RepID=UPI003D1F3541